MPKFDLTDPKTRAYLYRVGIALTMLLAGYGFLNGQTLALVNLLLGAVLSVAHNNVPSGDGYEGEQE